MIHSFGHSAAPGGQVIINVFFLYITVQRFKGKVMAITGYEVDQVTHNGQKLGTDIFNKNSNVER